MKCQRCHNNEGERYRRNTAYNEDEKNYAICCKECQELDNKEMDDLWKSISR